MLIHHPCMYRDTMYDPTTLVQWLTGIKKPSAAFLPGTRVNELACAAQGKTGLVFANLIFASTILLHLFLLSLPSSPFSPLAPLSMQIGLSLHAHAINPHSDTHAHVQQSTRWGMCPRSPPPPPPHRHPRLPGAHEAAASLQQPSPMRVR